MILTGLSDEKYSKLPVKGVVALDAHINFEELRKTCYTNTIPFMTRRGFLNRLFLVFYRDTYLKNNIDAIQEFPKLKAAGVDMKELVKKCYYMDELEGSFAHILADCKTKEEYYAKGETYTQFPKIKVPVFMFHCLDDTFIAPKVW